MTTREGFTLVEVLVSLLILTIGIMSLSQLSWFSTRMSTSGYFRTVAHVQALDMSERMWLDLGDPLGQVDAWEAVHSGSLPGWSGSVEVPDAGDPDLYQIQIQWTDNASGGAAEYEYFVRIPRIPD